MDIGLCLFLADKPFCLGLWKFLSAFALIAHEVNQVTTPLLRAGAIDFLITQKAESLVRKTRQVLIDVASARGPVRELNHVPFQVVTEFNLDSEAGNLCG
jgi:hypothetical protein